MNDPDKVVSHDLNPPIRARYIRFRPVVWNSHISVRVELYGCQGNQQMFFFWTIRLLNYRYVIVKTNCFYQNFIQYSQSGLILKNKNNFSEASKKHCLSSFIQISFFSFVYIIYPQELK